MIRGRFVAAACLVLACAPGAHAASSIPASIAPFLSAPSRALPLPARPTDALIDSVRALSSLAGYRHDPTATIRAARLPAKIAGRLANTSNALFDCARITQTALTGVTVARLQAAMKGGVLDPARFAGIAPCAQRLWTATRDLEVALRSAAAPPESVDIWPVLRLETGDAPNFYKHDYMLLVDLGGDDSYMNNAGSNVVDIKHGPAGSAATMKTEFAPGCQTAINGLTTGDCLPFAGVLLDLAGNDSYGVKQSPEPTFDGRCTAEPVIRRQVTGGVGFAGVGILRDVTGDDTYTGKTVSLGAGHIFGVGILSDAAGNDSYSAIRNSEGFGLLGGLGILHDESGDDVYTYEIPSAIDPNARNETDGAGGVIDDTANCDNRARFTAGAANLPGATGALVDDLGNDAYNGGYSQDYIASLGVGRGGSIGFADNDGFGFFYDGAGNDGYAIPAAQGAPLRGNAVTIQPGSESTGAYGSFVDR